MLRLDAVRRIGGYREDLNAQDGFDIWTRLKSAYECGNINVPLFYYRQHAANLTRNSERIFAAKRNVKEDVASSTLEEHRPVVAVIPCRKNYDYCPNVWSEKLGGQTLLHRTIEMCLASTVFDKIYVSSDTRAVVDVVNEFDDPRISFSMRNKEDTLRTRSLVFTLKDLVLQEELPHNSVLTVAYVQASFMATKTLEESVYTLIMNAADSAFSLDQVRAPLFRRTAHGLAPLNDFPSVHTDFSEIYRDSRTTFSTRASNVISGSLTGARMVHFLVPEDETFFILSERDMQVARKLLDT